MNVPRLPIPHPASLALGVATLATLSSLLLPASALAQGINGFDPRDPERSNRRISAAPTRLARMHGLSFGLGFAGIWGGAYASERALSKALALEVVYDDGHTEPVDFTVWSASLHVTYEYGPDDLRLQATLMARFDTQSYSAGAEGYQPLTGNSILAARYGLLLGPALTLVGSKTATLDAGLGAGAVLGSYDALAGVLDAFAEVGGAVNRPVTARLSGLGGRAWLNGTLWGQDRAFGWSIGLYYDVDWLHANLPRPLPTLWVNHSFGGTTQLSTRF
jgi:hypothetical protein